MKTFVRKIVRSYKRLRDGLLFIFADRVYTFTSSSKSLPDPVPTMTELLDAITAFNKLVTASDMNRSVQAEEKKKARATLLDLLDQLADWVTLTARTDAAVLASSGFYLNKLPSPRHISTPQNVRVTDGPNSGQLTVDCDTVKYAVSYIHQYSLTPDAEDSAWVSAPSTAKTYTFTGLSAGKTYYCRIASVGTKNAIMFSKAVSRIVQ